MLIPEVRADAAGERPAETDRIFAQSDAKHAKTSPRHVQTAPLSLFK
jgi:hypothetical protein